MGFSIGKELVSKPRVLFQITRNFAFENINIVEVISIDLGIIFIVDKKDALRGYKALKKLIT